MKVTNTFIETVPRHPPTLVLLRPNTQSVASSWRSYQNGFLINVGQHFKRAICANVHILINTIHLMLLILFALLLTVWFVVQETIFRTSSKIN